MRAPWFGSLKNQGSILVQSDLDRSHKSYDEKEELGYWATETREQALKKIYQDDSSLANWLKSFAEGRVWRDVGTGLSGILDLLKGSPKIISAVEPQLVCQKTLKDLGFDIAGSLDELPSESLEVCAFKKLKPNGALIIEVPHARDALLKNYHCFAFEDFTFWTVQQLLHTKMSLRVMAESAGFCCKEIIGFQRLPLASHLSWLTLGEFGAHVKWDDRSSSDLNEAYAVKLAQDNLTDTIIGVFVST